MVKCLVLGNVTVVVKCAVLREVNGEVCSIRGS